MYYQGQQNNVLPQTQKDGMNMQGGMQTRSSSSKLSKKKVMKILAGVVVMNCLYSNFSDPSARRTEASFSQTSPSVPLELLQAIQANNIKDKTKLASSDGRDLLESQDANDINNEEKDDNMKRDTSEPKNDERDLRRGDDDDGDDDDDDNNDNDEGDEKDAEDDGEEQVHGLMSKFFKKKEGDDEDGNGNGKGNDAEFKTFMEEKDQEPIYDITKLTSSDASNPDSDPRDLTFLSDPINEQVNVGESLRSLNFAYPDDEPERKKELRNLNFAYPGSDSDNDEEKSDRGGRDEDGDRDLDRDEYDDRDSNGDGRSSRGGDGEMNEPDVDSPYHLKNLNLDPESLQNMDAETLNKILEVNNINPDVLPKFGDDMGMGGGSSSGSSGSGGGSNQFDQDRFQGGDNGMRASDSSFGAGGGGGGDQFGDNAFQSGGGGSGRGGFNDNFQPDMRSSEGGGSILDIAQNNMAGSNEFNSGGDMRSNDSGFGGNQFNGGSNDFGSGSGSGSSNGNDNGFQQGGMASNNSAMSGGPSFDNCDARPWIPAPKQERVTPTMNASYPGSGARLSWKLIRAVTGHMTSDDAVDDGQIARQGLAISIKTHYPAHGSNDELFKPFSTVERSVLLVRNPANAIPSFLSYLYERQNGLENHSTRAPLDYWVEWRDNNFDQELQSWVEHTLFWLEHNRKENLLVVAYEHLIDPKYGPDELANIGNFIAQTSGIQLPQKPENIPCVWDYVVNSRGDKQPQSHRSGGPKRWPYTDRQIDMLVSYLSSLGKMYPEMAYIMDEYIVDCLAIQAYSRNMSLNGSN